MIERPRIARARRRRGAVAVFMAICLVPLIGVLAFVLDGGILLGQRRRAQTVADASAHAAAVVLCNNYLLNSGLDPQGKAAAAALSVASANGFANDGVNTTVAVHIPPTSGANVNAAGYAEVIVQLNQARFFSGIWSAATIPVSARSVGRVKAVPDNSMILLDPSVAGAFTITGSGKVATSATIQVDSSNAGAINANNAGHITAPVIAVTGNIANSGGTITGTLSPNAPSVADPLASLVAPAVPSNAGSTLPGYGSATIGPGRYDNGLSIQNGLNVTLLPGLYYLKGGGLSIANGATVAGTGVTFYVPPGSGQVSFQGGGIISITAPTTGPYAGVAIYQDRANATKVDIANGTFTTIGGSIYAPSAPVQFAGGALFQVGGIINLAQYYGQLIAKTVSVSNNANIQVTSSTSGATKSVSLVE